MRFFRLIILCLLFPVITWAQGTITGKIVRNDTKSPVQGANVFLSNSSYGTATGSDGTFTLNNVKPGQYTFTVAHLGLADYTQTILVGKEPLTVNVNMLTKPIILREVTISTTAKADWERNYAMFKEQFIGTDENAKYCEVINPDVLYFTYYKTQKTLLADADKFLIVDNKALGYRVKFLVHDFKYDAIAGIIQYSGQKVFEDLPGKEAQKKKWNTNRNLAYYGSAMHFYRSLYTDRLQEEGFEMHRYTRYINPIRPPEAVIQRNFERFKSLNMADSARKYIEYENMSKYYHEMYYPEQSFISDVLGKTDQQGLFAFTFPDCMCVQYIKKRDETHYRDIYLPLNVPNYETSILTFMTKENYCIFDMNGIVVNNGPLYEGTWSKSRLSQLLPVDYQPTPQEIIPVRSVVLKNN